MAWTAPEMAAIAVLEADGFNPTEAMIVTAMVSRRYARQLEKLVDVLSGHTGLEDTHAAQSAISNLISAGLLSVIHYAHRDLIIFSRDGLGILEATGKGRSCKILGELENVPVIRLESLGPMADKSIVASFREAVVSAERLIRLPFFSSTANIEGVEYLHQRALAGVELRIMLGSPSVMRVLRGASHETRTKRAIASWKEKTKDWPNTEVRIAQRASDIELGGSMSIDGRLLRLDVHEPLVERSIYGEMIAFYATGANVIRMFDSQFDVAWLRAQPTRLRARVLPEISSWKWAVTTALSFTAIWLVSNLNWRELLIGITVTALFAALDESKRRIQTVWRRLLGRDSV